uniref:Uncharacterized protein n=1 Tax=Corvus moneduloides TaxID=1196302 RepID=A0A8U7NE21_CORMO
MLVMGQLLMVPSTCACSGELPALPMSRMLRPVKTCGFFPVQVLSYLGGVPKVEETDLKPRVGFLYSIVTHNISILINDTQEQDSGQYMCTVNVVDDTIRLEKNVGIINLTVLGKAAPGKVASGAGVLTNLSLEMSGVYVCRAENQAGSKNCSIILEVHSRRGVEGFPEPISLMLSPLGREDAMAPKTPSWARSPASDTMSKTSTLSSIAGTRQPYGARPPSDTASILTTTGSYRGPPARGGGRPPNPSTPAVNGTPRRRQDPAATPGSLPPSSLARAGAVPVMVPAQSRAGSLV